MFKVNTPCSSDSIVNFEHVNADWEFAKYLIQQAIKYDQSFRGKWH